MNDYGWFFTGLFALFASVYGLIWRAHKKTADMNTRVTVLEEQNIQAQLQLISHNLELFRKESREAAKENSEKLWDEMKDIGNKIEDVRKELKSDIQHKADK